MQPVGKQAKIDIYIDFGADGLHEKNGKRFKDNLDSLSYCLSDLFKDHSAGEYKKILQEGFRNEDRTFGSVKCYPVTIENKVKGALILALRSHYDASVIEVIAPVFLRKQLKLKDGHKVKVEVLTLP